MKIKLSDGIIDTSKIKKIYSRPKKLHSGLNKIIRPHYSIEYIDGYFKVINKQEYKILKNILKEGE